MISNIESYNAMIFEQSVIQAGRLQRTNNEMARSQLRVLEQIYVSKLLNKNQNNKKLQIKKSGVLPRLLCLISSKMYSEKNFVFVITCRSRLFGGALFGCKGQNMLFNSGVTSLMLVVLVKSK